MSEERWRTDAVPTVEAGQMVEAGQTVEAKEEGKDPSRYRDNVTQQRGRPQSANQHRRGRGGGRGKGVGQGWQGRGSASGPGRRPAPKEGYRPLRSDVSYKGGAESRHDRVHRGRDDEDDKNKDLINWINSQIGQGTSYNGSVAPTPGLLEEPHLLATAGATQDCNKENSCMKESVGGNLHLSADAENTGESKELGGRAKPSRAADSGRSNDKSARGKHREREDRSKGQSRGSWRGRNYAHDKRGQFVQSERNTYNVNRRNDTSNGNQEMLNDHAYLHTSFQLSDMVVYNKDDFPRSANRPPQYNNYTHESNGTESARYSRGYRGKQRVDAGETGKSTRSGNRRDFSYRSQKEGVVRALSHLNPVQSSQASALIEQLRNEVYECMVCCEHVRCTASVWSCQNCHHVFHLGCIRKWAKSPTALVEGENGGWRCPGCQNITPEIPAVYKCFCGKVIDPEWRRHEGLTPHSCGELCGKQRDSSQCPHHCNQLCHPGPCPSCPVMVTKMCPCGRTTNRVRCSQTATVVCKLECNKVLNCFTHRCTRVCHPDPCGDCKMKVQQTCYCEKQHREALCGTGEPGFEEIDGKSGYFSCQDKCLRVLDCGNHYCQDTCHGGVCVGCLLKPILVSHCPCGKAPLTNLLGKENSRNSCLDPVPTCPLICDKILPCSPQRDGREAGASEDHRCINMCHLGECGPCDGMTKVKCRCGSNAKEIPCIERNLEEYTCDQRCNKKKQCGRHRCNQKCCTDTEHKCDLVCGKKLRCGYHKCLEPCHPGYCPPCLMSGFDELTCHCGATILYPPIPCGTPPPECNKPCTRTHSCSHPVNHTCHSEEACPHCAVLTKKKCMGDHEVRYNIPCHVSDVTCGKVCGKDLPCGHKCTKICHKPPCLEGEESCLHPCEIPRKECGHPCASQCHPNKKCPSVPCKIKVTVNCKCGRRSELFPCLQGGEKMAVAQAFQRLTTEVLADKMRDLQSGHSVDTSSIMSVDSKKPRQLECNSDCAIYERNKRLAEALNIENADLSPHSAVRYSPFLLAEAKHNLPFIKSVEEALENLVQTASKMSSAQRSHSFSPMSANQRRLVHEMSVFYNCASRSYDQEPKRNTVITATKESFLPSVKLSSQIEREINPPPPQPIPFLPSQMEVQSKQTEQGEKKSKTWAQVPDYFADDFDD